MKNFNKFAYAGTLLLAGTMGFAGCSSDDELANVNPSYDGKSVKAQFSINIPAKTTQSRMTSGVAQETTGAFNGMQKIQLVPMAVTGSENVADKTWSTVGLSNIVATDGWDNATLHAKVYNDVQFALGTNKVLFYGESMVGGSETGLTMLPGTKVGDTKFLLVTPYDSSNKTAIETYLLGMLNGVDGVLTAQADKGNVAALQQAFRGWVVNGYKVIAGSSQKILALMTNLYASVDAAKTADPVNAASYAAILTKIEEYFTVTGGVLAFKTGSAPTGVDDYPACANIPQGAVAVQYTDGTGFGYTISDINDASGFNMTLPVNYRKPSSLYYFVNSEVGTLTSEWLASNIGTATDWNTVTGVYTGTSVQSDTRSIILKDKVQYGVAALKSVIKANSANLKDESGADVTIGNNFKVTGILVGDQKDVDWEFKPVAMEGAYVVYDGVFTDGSSDPVILSTTPTSPGNFTLLLQTAQANNDDAVKVAIEIENNAADFYGKDHMLISKGTKFYLIGELKKTSGTTTNGATCIFQQDYMTTATFTVNSLANAYSVVPDLRSPKLEFGLAVDLEWQSGMTFDVTLD